MTDTTPERVRAIAPGLSRLSDDVLQMFIDDAKTDLARYSRYPRFGRYRERLQRYLAAHLATQGPVGGRATSERVGDVSATYNRPQGADLAGTEFGQEVLRMLRALTSPIKEL